MQQQREQQQQQCLAGYLQRPEDAPGEAMRGKQPQQRRPTGHINFPRRPQHTRQGALDAPLETRAEGSAFQRRSVWASIKCKWATPHQAQRADATLVAGGRWHRRCPAARSTLRSIIKLLRDLLTTRKAITTQSNETATMLPARSIKANGYYSF